MGESWQRAFLSSLVLAQIGEFSFVLGAAALDHAIIGTEIHRLIVAVTVISLVTSPLWMDGARRLRHRSAGRIDSLGRMFRLIYFREVRLARRTGRHGIQLCLRSEEHTSELQSLMRISYAVLCLKKKNEQQTTHHQ